MKNIKFVLVAFVAIFLTLGSMNVFAQEDGNRDANGYVVKGPYLTNGGWANWFAGVGGGLNTTYGKEIKPLSEFELKNNWSAEAFIGKWYTPSIGARIGYKGVANNFGYDADTYASDVYGDGEQVRFGYVHGDFMFNFSNAVSGYKETRTWDIIPYVGAGYLGINNGTTDDKFAVGAGIYNEFRLGRTVNLYVDLSVIGTENSVGLYSVEDGTPVINPDVKFIERPLYIPTATVGFTVNLGKKKNFDRYSSVAPAPMPFTLDEYNQLSRLADNLQKENSKLKDELLACSKKEQTKVYVPVTKTVAGNTVITFKMGSAKLSKVEREKVEMFAKSIEGTNAIVKVVGSADSKTGSKKTNEQLSLKRSDVVRDALIKSGVGRIDKSATLDAGESAETSRCAIISISDQPDRDLMNIIPVGSNNGETISVRWNDGTTYKPGNGTMPIE